MTDLHLCKYRVHRGRSSPLSSGTMLFAVLLVTSVILRVSTESCEYLLGENDGLILDCRSRTFTNIANISVGHDIARKVSEISLSHNSINQVQSRAFYVFENLHKLDLSYNSISSLDEDSFEGLHRLRELNLAFNPQLIFCRESYPPSLLRDAVLLEKIILNGITNVSSEYLVWPTEALSRAKSLSTLMIVEASGDAFPIPASLSNLTSLRSLEFIKTHFYRIRRSDIASIAHSPIETMSFRGGVKYISADTFTNFKNLKTLNFGCNKELMSDVFNVLSTSVNHSIDSLGLDMTRTFSGWTLLGEQDAYYGCRSILSSLRRLTFRGCGIRGFHSAVFKCLSNLEIFAIGLNTPYLTEEVPTSLEQHMKKIPPKLILLDFQYGMVTSYAQAVETTGCAEHADSFLQNSESAFPQFPPLINISIPGFSLVPPRQYNVPDMLSDWDGTNMYQSDVHGCWHVFIPAIIRAVFLQRIVFQAKDEIKCMVLHDVNIRFMNMSNCYNAVRRLVGPVSGLDAMEVFDGSSSILEALPRGSILSLHSLTHLNLSKNSLGIGGFDLDLDVAPNLIDLDLSFNRITGLNWTVFSAARKMEYLKLGNNKLTSVALDLSHLTMLKSLQLQWNQISRLHPSFTTALEDHYQKTGKKVELDLRGNELSCQCDALEFVEWMQNTESVMLNANGDLECENPDGVRVKLLDVEVSQYRKKCTRTNLSLVLTAALLPICITIAALLSAVVGYRYRWSIKWNYHKQKRKLRHSSHPSGLKLKVGGYDAYVAYSSDDDRTRRWVCGTLREELEVKRPFSLFLEDRNSVPGGAIAENIVEALDHSRCSLWILNDAFLTNSWCDYALHMSLVCHGQSRICIVLMSEVGQATTMPRYLERILHPRSDYLRVEQTSNVAGDELMWTTLNDFLLQRRNLPQYSATGGKD